MLINGYRFNSLKAYIYLKYRTDLSLLQIHYYFEIKFYPLLRYL